MQIIVQRGKINYIVLDLSNHIEYKKLFYLKLINVIGIIHFFS